MKNDSDQQTRWLLRDKYRNKQGAQFFRDIQRLKKGEPISYVIGWMPFLNCKIDLSLRPLIPRPETEYWVEKAIQTIQSIGRQGKIADAFSGSGCIGVSVLKNLPNTKVDFFEIDKKAVKQIRMNLRLNQIKASRYHILGNDVFKRLKDQYDFILANPPYLAIRRKSQVPKSVLKYEPKKALFAGKDGLLYIKKFIPLAIKHLKTNGQLWLEFDSFEKKAIEKLLRVRPFIHYNFQRDQYGKWRYARISRLAENAGLM